MTYPLHPAPPADAAESRPPVAHAPGVDPALFEWTPVTRQPRSDGWSPAAQRAFIEALADTGSVTEAAALVGKSVTSCYRLRRAPGAHGFAAAWQAALAEGTRNLGELALDRVINGSKETLLDGNGNLIQVRRTNDRLLMFLLRAHDPARYRPD